jgi:hypothetical protein
MVNKSNEKHKTLSPDTMANNMLLLLLLAAAAAVVVVVLFLLGFFSFCSH